MQKLAPKVRMKSLQNRTTAEQRHILLKEFNSKRNTSTDILFVAKSQVSSETFKVVLTLTVFIIYRPISLLSTISKAGAALETYLGKRQLIIFRKLCKKKKFIFTS